MAGFALAVAIVAAPGADQRAYAEDDEEVAETVIVHSNRRERRREGSGLCGSCGVVTFRIPSPSQVENGKGGVSYETSRKPNEADAALLIQCAAILEQIQRTSIAAWYRPSGKTSPAADDRNDLIEQFNATCSDLFPDNPDLGLDASTAVSDYMNR
jgi:hypothetical protein